MTILAHVGEDAGQATIKARFVGILALFSRFSFPSLSNMNQEAAFLGKIRQLLLL